MIKLFDTPSRQLREVPVDKDILMYICGITPYDSAHLGHVFTFLTYDLLQRRLEDLGHTVRLVRNITDVDEPIFKKAAENNEDYRELAQRETKSFQNTMRTLNFRQPESEPKASEYIEEMATAVKQLLDDGYAYHLDEDIYFDTARADNFGSFSGFSDKLQLGFMKDRGGDPDRPGKRNQLDFLLWRGIHGTRNLAAWESPIGRGRPGWHIECSVMSYQTLGAPLTIHGGGMDLIFPHHECEIAQSNALGHQALALQWTHVAPMLLHGEKMSKSLGNLVFAKDLLRTYKPGVIRLAMMHYHYRIGGEWQQEALDKAQSLYDTLNQALSHHSQVPGTAFIDTVRDALDNDLDVHKIVHTLQNLATETLALEKSVAQPNRASSHDVARSQLEDVLLLLGIGSVNPTNNSIEL